MTRKSRNRRTNNKNKTTSLMTWIQLTTLVSIAISTSLILAEVRSIRTQPASQTPPKPIILESPLEYLTCSVTAYTNHPNETDKDNLNTATMEKPVPGWTCAVSQDLIHWLGGRIYIQGIGVRKVNDLMNKKYEKSIDLCVGNKKQARRFGRKTMQAIFLGR